jgi:hypothetical protein
LRGLVYRIRTVDNGHGEVDGQALFGSINIFCVSTNLIPEIGCFTYAECGWSISSRGKRATPTFLKNTVEGPCFADASAHDLV